MKAELVYQIVKELNIVEYRKLLKLLKIESCENKVSPKLKRKKLKIPTDEEVIEHLLRVVFKYNKL